MKKNLCKNNLNSVKDIYMIYVNFIITVKTVSEREREKKRRHYFHTVP